MGAIVCPSAILSMPGRFWAREKRKEASTSEISMKWAWSHLQVDGLQVGFLPPRRVSTSNSWARRDWFGEGGRRSSRMLSCVYLCNMSVSMSIISFSPFSDRLILPLRESVRRRSPVKFYPWDHSHSYLYRIDPTIHKITLFKWNIHIQHTSGTNTTVQCDLHIIRDNLFLWEIAGLQRHCVTNYTLNAVTVIYE